MTRKLEVEETVHLVNPRTMRESIHHIRSGLFFDRRGPVRGLGTATKSMWDLPWKGTMITTLPLAALPTNRSELEIAFDPYMALRCPGHDFQRHCFQPRTAVSFQRQTVFERLHPRRGVEDDFVLAPISRTDLAMLPPAVDVSQVQVDMRARCRNVRAYKRPELDALAGVRCRVAHALVNRAVAFSGVRSGCAANHDALPASHGVFI
jgi:hypothetical protein